MPSPLKKTTKGLQESYFGYLIDHFFRIRNSLDTGMRKYNETLVEQYPGKRPKLLDEWFNLYNQLVQMFDAYLKEPLHIQPMNTKPNMVFSYDIHDAIDTEPSEGQKNNAIKSVLEDGFIYEKAHKRIVVQKAKVIVVKN